MLRMMRKMIQHEYVFLHKLEMLKHHVIWCTYIYLFGSPTIIFYWKGFSSSKGTTIFTLVATTSMVCLWKPIGPLHSYTSGMLLFKMWWSFWSAKEHSLCSQSDKNSPKTNITSMAMEGWSSQTVCLPCFLLLILLSLVPQMSHFCPTKDFQMMLQVYLRLPWKSGPSECGKKELFCTCVAINSGKDPTMVWLIVV